MARERAKLTDKQERILVQSQLMGLTTADMIRIANRMKALEKERELKQGIDAVVSNFTYEASLEPKTYWKITEPSTGKVYTFTNRRNKQRDRWSMNHSIDYDVAVDKPGTRFETRKKNGVGFPIPLDTPAKFCPDKSKELYALMRGIVRGSCG